jgi:hypothetical protein
MSGTGSVGCYDMTVSDALPRPANEPIQPPPPSSMPAAMPPPGMPAPRLQPAATGAPPADISGVYYSTGWNILLVIVTFGIWGIFWTYRTSEDLKRYNRQGLGGAIGILLYLVISIALMFTIPNEIEGMYQRDGRTSPVGTLLGLWFLLPLIGNIIWYVKVQKALNEFWASKGANAR